MAGPFDAPNVNWQLLADLPDQWAAGKKWREEQDLNAARKKAFSSGVFDPQTAVQQLLAFGDVEGASKAASIAKALRPEGLTPYQRESLALQREGLIPPDVRTLQFFQNQAGSTSAAPGVGEVPGFFADKFKSGAEKEAEKQRVKADVEFEADLKGKAQGARSFLTKVQRLENFIKTTPNAPDLFGPIQGSQFGRTVGAMFGTEAERKRTQLQAMLRDLELDVARFKLKGQGVITDAERQIARETLPQLTNVDPQAALDIIKGLKQEAQDTIAGGTQPANVPTSPPGFSQPPINEQTAPPVPGATQMNIGPGADPRGALFPPQQAGAAPSPVTTDIPQIPAAVGKARQAMELGASPQEIAQALQIDGVPPDVIQQILAAMAQGPQ